VYCGFYSTSYDKGLADDYLTALQLETESVRHLRGGRAIKSVYIGGGTPTTLSEQQFDRLFHCIGGLVRPAQEIEVTVETNPGTVTPAKLAFLKQLGVTRLSIGVQSFSDELLHRLGRRHHAHEAVTAVRLAKKAGFDTVGIDLMYGIPGQTADEWKDTIDNALALSPEHLSLYSLSIDEGSRLASLVRSGRFTLPDDDVAAGMYETAKHRVQEEGFRQYELSNFSLPSHECRHNLHYWDRREYIGLGPSAWSFIGDRRWANIPDVRQYIDRLRRAEPVIHQQDVVNDQQAAAESLFLGLRRTAGVDLVRYTGRLGEAAVDVLGERISTLSACGLVEIVQGRLRLTDRGMLLSNEAMARLLP
jgi:oxygen-independent coproporphyrinogen-3 oxidase